ncbi:MAG: ribonuclease HII [Oligoflexales bacterium]|nr:ribonuclease HII [Oligoflexales bacterium]
MKFSALGEFEKHLTIEGHSIIGVDEVGRGCLAGPVYAGCVSLNYEALHNLPERQRLLIKDSKKLTSRQRNLVLPIIFSIAIETEVAEASVFEIEQLGIVNATFLAMNRALSQCKNSYSILLVDGNKTLPGYGGHQESIIRGDSSCYSIAAASILAKESRDAYMKNIAYKYPGYGFEHHVGYGTKEHIETIKKQGICPLHRRNFAPINLFASL